MQRYNKWRPHGGFQTMTLHNKAVFSPLRVTSLHWAFLAHTHSCAQTHTAWIMVCVNREARSTVQRSELAFLRIYTFSPSPPFSFLQLIVWCHTDSTPTCLYLNSGWHPPRQADRCGVNALQREASRLQVGSNQAYSERQSDRTEAVVHV